MMPICGKAGLLHKKSLVSEAYMVVYVHDSVHIFIPNTTYPTLILQHFLYSLIIYYSDF